MQDLKSRQKPFQVIQENFRFILVEVIKQVEDTLQLLEAPSDALLEKIYTRDDYVDGLKGLIEEKCFSHILTQGELSKKSVALIRSIVIIATNLERIGDFAVAVAGQSKYFTDPDFIKRYDYHLFFREVLTALADIMGAIQEADSSAALRICKCESNLDDLFKNNFQKIIEELRTGKEIDNLVTVLSIIRYLERMGDSLLNIGEAILYALMGEKLKIRQMEALRKALDTAGKDTSIKEMDIESIWGHRSGCKIGIVGNSNSVQTGPKVFFKQGKLKKVERERNRLLDWENAVPDLVPKVIAFSGEGPNASLLLEYLEGCTFLELLISASWDVIENTMFIIKETVAGVWTSTKRLESFQTNYIEQLIQRKADVYHIHPNFRVGAVQIGNKSVASLEEIISELEINNPAPAAPFQVLIHGDFNVDNVLYDHKKQKVYFIDLYRSGFYDYVQDVTVFLVSNFRLPIFDKDRRKVINAVIKEFLEFATEFSERHNDETFHARIAFGLARSFFTSTRFEFESKFAKTMYLRSIYILESLRDHGEKPWSQYRINYDLLYLN